MLLSSEKEIERQVDLLARAFPGQVCIPLAAACHAISMARKTFFNRRLEGNPPFTARRAGGRLVVPIVDVARAALGLPPALAADPAKILQGKKGAAASAAARRRGRPTREEEEEAARAGLTVKELRARQRGGSEGGAQ